MHLKKYQSQPTSPKNSDLAFKVVHNKHRQSLSKLRAITSPEDCLFCIKFGKKDYSRINFKDLLNRALFTKYSQQNQNNAQEFEDLFQDKPIKWVINFKDQICYEENDDYLKRIYASHEQKLKLDQLLEYYKYHKDIPRMFMRKLSSIAMYFYERKKRFLEYNQIKRQLGISIEADEQGQESYLREKIQKLNFQVLQGVQLTTHLQTTETERQSQVTTKSILKELVKNCESQGKTQNMSETWMSMIVQDSLIHQPLHFSDQINNLVDLKATKSQQKVAKNSKPNNFKDILQETAQKVKLLQNILMGQQSQWSQSKSKTSKVKVASDILLKQQTCQPKSTKASSSSQKNCLSGIPTQQSSPKVKRKIKEDLVQFLGGQQLSTLKDTHYVPGQINLQGYPNSYRKESGNYRSMNSPEEKKTQTGRVSKNSQNMSKDKMKDLMSPKAKQVDEGEKMRHKKNAKSSVIGQMQQPLKVTMNLNIGQITKSMLKKKSSFCLQEYQSHRKSQTHHSETSYSPQRMKDKFLQFQKFNVGQNANIQSQKKKPRAQMQSQGSINININQFNMNNVNLELASKTPLHSSKPTPGNPLAKCQIFSQPGSTKKPTRKF